MSLPSEVKHRITFPLSKCTSMKQYSLSKLFQHVEQYTSPNSSNSSWKTWKLWTFSSYLNRRESIQRITVSYKALRTTFIFHYRYLPHHLPVNLFVLIFWSSTWPLLQGYLDRKNKSHHLINQANLHLSPAATLSQGEYSKNTTQKKTTGNSEVTGLPFANIQMENKHCKQ